MGGGQNFPSGMGGGCLCILEGGGISPIDFAKPSPYPTPPPPLLAINNERALMYCADMNYSIPSLPLPTQALYQDILVKDHVIASHSDELCSLQ